MRRLGPLLSLLALAGCSGSDDPTGPGPGPTGPPVIESFLTTDATLTHGDFSTLRWRVAGADVVSILPDVGVVSSPATGTASVRPFQTVTYTLTASNEEAVVSATVTIDVQYFGGVYVNGTGGDDGATGTRPQEPIATLQEAMARTPNGGVIFLAAGVYDAAIVIQNAEHTILGGLNPTTFFEESEIYETWIRPTAATTPVTIRNSSAGPTFLSFVKVDARNGGAVAVEVDAALAIFEGCTFEARLSGSGTALLARNSANIEVRHSHIHGGRRSGGLHSETRGVALLDAASALVSACFIDGGSASLRSSGVDVATSGTVRLSFNTIGAQVAGSVSADVAAAVRLRAGRPSLGGNILFTRGTAERHAIVEEAADADPSWFMGNLFVSAGSPPYDNWSADGPDPTNEEQLNEPLFINDDASTIYLNRHVTDVSAQTILENLDLADFHLADTSPDPNPARNRGDAQLLNEDRFGTSRQDIDGKTRPSSPAQYDLGADEL